MGGKKIFCSLVAAAGLALVCSGQPAQKATGQGPGVGPAKPLIRKDLLRKKTRNAAAVRRDPFSPQSNFANTALPPVLPKGKTTPDEDITPPEAPSLTLHYIGFSENVSQHKFVAMVFFQEQVTAVQEGDTLGPGFKIRKITAKELQVEGPDGKILTFSLGGEQQ